MRRAVILSFIHVFLAIQIAAPLSYYACREDRSDERFAWRMFSTVRNLQCVPRFTIGAERAPVRPGTRFHEAWWALAQRGRLDVVRAMAARLCGEHPGQPVRIELACGIAVRVADKVRRLEWGNHGGGWDFCTTGAL